MRSHLSFIGALVLKTPRAHIQGRVQIATDLKQRKVGDEAAKGQDLIRSVHKVFLCPDGLRAYVALTIFDPYRTSSSLSPRFNLMFF